MAPRVDAEPAQDVARDRSRFGIAAQAARRTARRDRAARPARARAAAAARSCCLSMQHVGRAADERQPPGERLVEHDADRVPVAGRRRAAGARPARATCTRRCRRAVAGQRVRSRSSSVTSPKSRILTAPVARDEHVRRLEVAVQHARARGSRPRPRRAAARRGAGAQSRACRRRRCRRIGRDGSRARAGGALARRGRVGRQVVVVDARRAPRSRSSPVDAVSPPRTQRRKLAPVRPAPS